MAFNRCGFDEASQRWLVLIKPDPLCARVAQRCSVGGPEMAAARSKVRKLPLREPTEVRSIILRYFYDRNQKATSARGKKGFSVKISDSKRELKQSHELTQQEVVGNLNYLISQGWIEEERVEKSVPLRTGTVIPQSTSFYKISAAGIDRIEGPSEFTMDKFKGIRIEATGKNVITVGDGNTVNARFEDAANSLVELKQAILSSQVAEDEKMDAVADIDCIETQLVKSEPSRSVIAGAWEGLKRFETVLGVGEKLSRVVPLISDLLPK